MAKTGRKSKYETHVLPHLEEIREAVKNGATIKEIADAFGIAESTLNKYKAKKKELSDAFTCGRANIVIQIRGALLKKALGFNYEEEKRVGRKDAKGENVVIVEKYQKYCPPSETAAAMLLRNYDDTWLDKDSASTQLKQQEFELKKAIAECNNFDLDIKE